MQPQVSQPRNSMRNSMRKSFLRRTSKSHDEAAEKKTTRPEILKKIELTLEEKGIDMIMFGLIDDFKQFIIGNDEGKNFINNIDKKSGHTVLSCAADEGRLEFIELLLQYEHTEINKQSESHSLPLIYAAKRNYVDCVKILVESGADVNAIGEQGNTALLMACRFGQLKTVEYLVSQGVDVHIRNDAGDNALTMALKYSFIKIAEFLLLHNCDINIIFRSQNNALMRAIFDNNIVVARFILEHNGNIDAINANSETAFMIASKFHRFEFALELLKSMIY